uniref:GRIP domain-containing protein n=1 Tax=Strongyloides papillosus TaxID=174720 RepID=A0A0N5CFD5_STREA
MEAVDNNKNEIKQNLEEIENEKNKLKLLVNNLEAMQESINELSSNNLNAKQYQKMLQAHILNNMTLNNNIKSLTKKLEIMEKELNETKYTNEELEKINKDLYLLTIKPIEMTEIQSIDYGVYENLFKNNEDSKKNDNVEAEVDDGTSIKSDDLSSSKSISEKIKTVIIDNSEDYERDIQSIKKTAHIAIEGYKEQLKQKNKSIEEYKELLQKMIIEMKDMESNYIKKIKTIKENNKKVIETSPSSSSKEPSPDITQSNLYIKFQETISLKEKECVKHSGELKELQEAYLDLTNKYKSASLKIAELSLDNVNKKEIKVRELRDIGLQTYIEDTTINPQQSIESGSSSDNNENTRKISDDITIAVDNDNKNTNRSESTGSDISSTSGTSSISNNHEEEEKQSVKSSNIDGKSIISSREEMLILQQKNEIRRLRTKVINIERRNKELEAENSMISDKLSKYTRKTTCDLSNNLDVENQTLKTEITKLRREAVTMRKRIENLNKQVFELEKANKARKRSENVSVERWKQKKYFDETIDILKRQLSESKREQQELQEKLERRDRLIEQLHDEKGSLRIEAAMKRAKKMEAQNALAKSQANILEAKLKDEMTIQQTRIDTLKEKLTSLHNENISLKKKITKLEKEIIDQKEEFEKNREINEKRSENKVVVFEVDDTYEKNKDKVPELIVYDDSGYETTYRNQSSDSEENKLLRKELRMVEIRCVELTEQVTKLRLECLEYQEKYNTLKAKYDDKVSQDNQIASIMILKDKIESKERLISIQRQKIEDLEKELWETNNQVTSEAHSNIFY